jgi:hypothetical protein
MILEKVIIAIGGAVIKTAKSELYELIERNKVEMLIHNGGSIFHDFQTSIDYNVINRESKSYSLDELMENLECNKEASELVWNWIEGDPAPVGSVSELCEEKKIPVLLFTGMACDFWQLFREDWSLYARKAKNDFDILCDRMTKPFHYICMGSAVIHPEVFVKALSVTRPKKFKADVVDFLDMYRPRTRIAKYGKYYKMTHKRFIENCLEN